MGRESVSNAMSERVLERWVKVLDWNHCLFCLEPQCKRFSIWMVGEVENE